MPNANNLYLSVIFGDDMADLQKTPLFDLHVELGAKMVPFAGFEMPVQYPLGVMKEHLHTRSKAGLFDVSHMGQVILRGENIVADLEKLIPMNVGALAVGRQRYGFFTNEQGGILDDLMFANRDDHIFMVVNAARKDHDIAHLKKGLGEASVEVLEDRALLALQGLGAEDALAKFDNNCRDMRFMDVRDLKLCGAECWVSRSGYTGEDGYEISVPNGKAEELARALLSDDNVEAIGLGARDSLRLEAGLCLYGHDIDETTSPVEAGLVWAIQKSRRETGDFIGDVAIMKALKEGPVRKRVGLRPTGRAPMREGVVLFKSETSIDPIGSITSGGFGPSFGGPVAMGYVLNHFANEGAQVFGEQRGKRLPIDVVNLPFIPANFKR